MKQVNCTVTGKMTDVPYLTIDNGHIYHAVVESPSRVIFQIPDEEPTDGDLWGLTYFYGGKVLRGLVPQFPGAYEGPVLAYASALGRLSADGPYLIQNKKRWTWAMMTGFCDYQLYLDGNTEFLHQAWTQARDLGANGRRILGMMAFITRFDPRAYGDRYYEGLQPFVQAAAEYGLYIHFDVFADNQIFNLGQEHWARVCDQLRLQDSAVIGAGNEWPKNGFDPMTLPYPGVLSSQGSALSDAPPPMPGWGIRCFHPRRDSPKVWVGCEDAYYVGEGIDSNGVRYAPVAPVVIDEPIGFAEIDIPNRRSTNPRLAANIMLQARSIGSGATYHSEDGIFSRLLGPRQQTCARAFFDAQG